MGARYLILARVTGVLCSKLFSPLEEWYQDSNTQFESRQPRFDLWRYATAETLAHLSGREATHSAFSGQEKKEREREEGKRGGEEKRTSAPTAPSAGGMHARSPGEWLAGVAAWQYTNVWFRARP